MSVKRTPNTRMATPPSGNAATIAASREAWREDPMTAHSCDKADRIAIDAAMRIRRDSWSGPSPPGSPRHVHAFTAAREAAQDRGPVRGGRDGRGAACGGGGARTHAGEAGRAGGPRSARRAAVLAARSVVPAPVHRAVPALRAQPVSLSAPAANHHHGAGAARFRRAGAVARVPRA